MNRVVSFVPSSLRKHRWTALRLIVGVLCVVVLSGALILRRKPLQESHNTSSVEENMAGEGLAELPELTYELVLEEDEPAKLLRYKAKEKRLDGSLVEVPVHRWMSLLTHSNHQYAFDKISQFNTLLKEADMKAFFFETKGVSHLRAGTKTFEFVLVESSYLYEFADARQNPTDFGDKLQCKSSIGCVFPNLGGDSTLIAPAPNEYQANNIYGHLAAFVRRAPPTQILPFWRLALETFQKKLKENPAKTYWFSTDGTGVAWLHVRIDPTPKYYDYQPFAEDTDDLRDTGNNRADP